MFCFKRTINLNNLHQAATKANKRTTRKAILCKLFNDDLKSLSRVSERERERLHTDLCLRARVQALNCSDRPVASLYATPFAVYVAVSTRDKVLMAHAALKRV